MSKEDFDRFLALLGGFLNLDRKQRDAISDELRDHLEMRVESLMKAGIAENTAQQQALEEFGDAAGVAARFVSLAQLRTRRQMMRIASISTVLAIPLVIFTILFWPESENPIINAPAVAAQDENAVAETGEASGQDKDPFLHDRNSAQARINRRRAVQVKLGESTSNKNDLMAEKKLEELVSIEGGTVFQDLIDKIEQQIGLEVILDISAEDTITRDTEISEHFSLSNVRLKSALDLLLRKYDCTFTIQDGMMVIVSVDANERMTILRVYDVSDIVEKCNENGWAYHALYPTTNAGSFGNANQNAGAIDPADDNVETKPESKGGTAEDTLKAISTMVETDMWESQGGTARIVALGDRLIVSAPFGMNYKVKSFLEDLRVNMKIK